MNRIEPITETKDTVTLTRHDYDGLLDRLEEIADLGIVQAQRAHEARVGWDAARADHMTMEEVQKLMDGMHPLAVWRIKRGLTQRALADASGVATSYVTEIERRKKPGSVDALSKLAKALRVRIEDLLPNPAG